MYDLKSVPQPGLRSPENVLSICGRINDEVGRQGHKAARDTPHMNVVDLQDARQLRKSAIFASLPDAS